MVAAAIAATYAQSIISFALSNIFTIRMIDISVGFCKITWKMFQGCLNKAKIMLHNPAWKGDDLLQSSFF